jgi:hypothetical protein
LLSSARATPDSFREALARVPPAERDAWFDAVLGLDEIPDDGRDLPRGCVPYMPCPVDALLRALEHADVKASDVFVDIGSGLGRAMLLAHFLTGAAAIGLEIQPALVRISREIEKRMNVSGVSTLEGDAVELTARVAAGSVFFLYCPFSGERLERLLATLEPIARARPIRVCCVDLPLPARPWLTQISPKAGELAVYRSTILDGRG